jgi:hypothetical protein
MCCLPVRCRRVREVASADFDKLDVTGAANGNARKKIIDDYSTVISP